MLVCLSVLRKTIFNLNIMCSYMIVCSGQYLQTYRLQVGHVISEDSDSDDDCLALALRSLSFPSTSQTLFASY